MDAFNLGLEGSIGPPLMYPETEALQQVVSSLAPEAGHAGTSPSLLGQMEKEHCDEPDSSIKFPGQTNQEIVLPKAQARARESKMAGALPALIPRCACLQ